jgi:hypothetical protein
LPALANRFFGNGLLEPLETAIVAPTLGNL